MRVTCAWVRQQFCGQASVPACDVLASVLPGQEQVLVTESCRACAVSQPSLLWIWTLFMLLQVQLA